MKVQKNIDSGDEILEKKTKVKRNTGTKDKKRNKK